MKKIFFLISSLQITVVVLLNAQVANLPADSKPAPTNIRTDQCPCILSDLRVIFMVTAPDADKVQVDLGKVFDMQKNEKGIWTVTTDPQVPGFHYFSLVINGVRVSDPASESFYGTGRMSSAIDIPEDGGGEDERGWVVQGKMEIILDNLIAEGKAKPMIVVIPNGNVSRPGMTVGGYNDEAMDVFKEELFGSVIPFIESNYRVKPGAANRAIAGLSMGGGQAFYTGLRNTDIFAYVDVFSTGLFGGIGRQPGATFDPEAVIPGIMTNPQSFNNKLKVFYISVGEQDPRVEPTKKMIETLRSKGLKVEFASFPGSHEWQVWRKSVHDFAQKLFK